MSEKHTPDLYASCIEWEGAIDNHGYGRLNVKGKWVLAHRFAYEGSVCKIPDGLVIDHLCRNRRCINVLHMEAVTPKENVLRGNGISAKNKLKTHCINGHYIGEPKDVSRKCKICARRRWREYRLRKIANGTWENNR